MEGLVNTRRRSFEASTSRTIPDTPESFAARTSHGRTSFGDANQNWTNLYAANVLLPDDKWMGSNLGTLGNKTLKQICIPGSHDAGMSCCHDGTVGGVATLVQTQTKNIGQQLYAGARYFDIRPVIGGGSYWTGHYSTIDPIGTFGARGQSLETIVKEIQAFATTHQELIILSISHDMNTDVARTYPPFDSQDWQGFFTLMDSLSPFFSSLPTSSLQNTELNSFLSSGSCVLVIVDTSAENLPPGYHRLADFPVFDNYSNTPDLTTMMTDQIQKLQNNTPANYFVLSWTLTPQFSFNPTSVLSLASQANSALMSNCQPNPSHLPNVILIDDFAFDSPAMKLTLLMNNISSISWDPHDAALFSQHYAGKWVSILPSSRDSMILNGDSNSDDSQYGEVNIMPYSGSPSSDQQWYVTDRGVVNGVPSFTFQAKGNPPVNPPGGDGGNTLDAHTDDNGMHLSPFSQTAGGEFWVPMIVSSSPGEVPNTFAFFLSVLGGQSISFLTYDELTESVTLAGPSSTNAWILRIEN
jgi:hypothetical protein